MRTSSNTIHLPLARAANTRREWIGVDNVSSAAAAGGVVVVSACDLLCVFLDPLFDILNIYFESLYCAALKNHLSLFVSETK